MLVSNLGVLKSKDNHEELDTIYSKNRDRAGFYRRNLYFFVELKVFWLYDEISANREQQSQLALYLAESRLNSLNSQLLYEASSQRSNRKTRKLLGELITLAVEDVDACMSQVAAERQLSSSRMSQALERHRSITAEECLVDDGNSFWCFVRKMRAELVKVTPQITDTVGKVVNLLKRKKTRDVDEVAIDEFARTNDDF
jgi:hypothetical protein